MSLVPLRDEGSGSVPALEYTAPPEDAVNGNMAFDCFSMLYG